MKRFIQVTVVTLALSFTALYAGSGHSHSHDSHGHNHSHHEHSALDKTLSNTEIKKIAKQKVETLVLKKKIPKSWNSAEISKLGKDQSGRSNDWVVVFENTKIKNKTKQNLYIFLNLYGDVAGANYTGK